TGPIPRVDRNLHAEALGGAAVPADRREALRLPRERLDVGTVAAVDGDSLAERDVADDLVTRNRRAAFCKPHQDVVYPVDVDAVVLTPDRVLGPRRLERDSLLVGDLLGLEALQHLVHDLLCADLSGPEREVEVLRLLEVHVADHL